MYKREKKSKGQTRMGNLETQATLGTRHRTQTNKTNIATQKTTRTPPKKPWMNSGAHER